MRTSLERILDWDLDQIIVGHGAVVGNHGKEVFRTAFRCFFEMIEVNSRIRNLCARRLAYWRLESLRDQGDILIFAKRPCQRDFFRLRKLEAAGIEF